MRRWSEIMNEKTKSGLPGIVFALLCTSLIACSSTPHLFVEKKELVALDQCITAQQSQQQLLAQQLTQHEETIKLLSESLEEQKRLAAIPSVPAEKAPNCPKTPLYPQPADPAKSALLENKQVVGEREQVLFNGLDIVMSARVDTGATTASLDARNIQSFERNGEEWVRFTVYDPQTRAPVEVERRRARRVHIVQASTEEPERRPVVEMRVTVGKVTQNAEFTLSDRSSMEFPVLIGRNILRDVMLVDVSRSGIAPPVREEKKEESNAIAKPKAVASSAASAAAKSAAQSSVQAAQ
jgi:hypothetical protein